MQIYCKKEPMNNKKAKNAERVGGKLRIRKSHSVKTFLKLVWKIHEVARCKGPLS